MLPINVNSPSSGLSPRVRGTLNPQFFSMSSSGLSPRVRGNLDDKRCILMQHGSIPACAGEPDSFLYSPVNSRSIPRVCGGTIKEEGLLSTLVGLSPRVRGNLLHPHNLWAAGGSIPRVCGGTTVTATWVAGQIGSIPACAGEPWKRVSWCLPSRVYPRVCGGTHGAEHPDRSGRGLSPRVRGNHREYSACLSGAGSIPACAGEPIPSSVHEAPVTVYPRVCGGTEVSLNPY